MISATTIDLGIFFFHLHHLHSVVLCVFGHFLGYQNVSLAIGTVGSYSEAKS